MSIMSLRKIENGYTSAVEGSGSTIGGGIIE
jgi:hypothetical protein